jgi:hypothetical protein
MYIYIYMIIRAEYLGVTTFEHQHYQYSFGLFEPGTMGHVSPLCLHPIQKTSDSHEQISEGVCVFLIFPTGF